MGSSGSRRQSGRASIAAARAATAAGRAPRRRSANTAGAADPRATAPRQRLSAAVRRAQLTAVALRLFASRGFGGTTTKAIADAAGVSEGIIFRHFATKEDLYVAILQERVLDEQFDSALTGLRAAMAKTDDGGLVGQVVRLTLKSYRRKPDFYRMMLFAALEGIDLAKASQRVIGTPIFELFRDYVSRRQASGAFRAGRPELLAFGILALPVHFAMVTTLFGPRRANATDDEIAETFTDLILGGMLNAADAPSPSPAADTAATPAAGAPAPKPKARRERPR